MKSFMRKYAGINCVAVVLNVAISAGLFLAGMHPTWLTFLCGYITFITVSVVLAWLRRAGRFPEEIEQIWSQVSCLSVRDICGIAYRFAREYPVLIVALVLAFTVGGAAPDVATLPQSTQTAHRAAEVIGLIVIVSSVVWDVILLGTGMRQVLSLAVSAMSRVLLLIAGLRLIRAFGAEISDLVLWLMTNPEKALAFAIGLAVVRASFLLMPPRRPERIAAYGTDWAAGGVSGILAPAVEKQQRHPADIKRTAIHEAGHLMLYAGLQALPPDLGVRIHTARGCGGTLGLVFNPGGADLDATERTYKWQMYLYLAGTEAEFAMLGERGNGATADNRSWLNTTTQYLSGGMGEVFYAAPENESQILHNRHVLNALKESQIKRLGEFFSINATVLTELADEIVAKTEMDMSAIKPFLDRVQIFDDMKAGEAREQ